MSLEQLRDVRARTWKFIFDAYRKKAAEQQSNCKTKQKSSNTEEGGPHDLEARMT